VLSLPGVGSMAADVTVVAIGPVVDVNSVTVALTPIAAGLTFVFAVQSLARAFLLDSVAVLSGASDEAHAPRSLDLDGLIGVPRGGGTPFGNTNVVAGHSKSRDHHVRCDIRCERRQLPSIIAVTNSGSDDAASVVVTDTVHVGVSRDGTWRRRHIV